MHPALRFPTLPKDRLSRALSGLESVTARELLVLQATLDGETSKQMAARLGISSRTADVHRMRALGKLGLEGIPELLRFAAGLGIGPAVDAPETTAGIEHSALEPTGSAKLGDILTGAYYAPTPPVEAISVFMTWDRAGNAAGFLLVPDNLRERLDWLGMPPPATTRPLPNAISYGFLLAIMDGRQLCLTGDLAVWDESWGPVPRVLPLSHRAAALSIARGRH